MPGLEAFQREDFILLIGEQTCKLRILEQLADVQNTELERLNAENNRLESQVQNLFVINNSLQEELKKTTEKKITSKK